MAQHNDLGRWGEQMAAEYLERKGWYIRHIDWRSGHRDLDVVAIDEDMSVLLVAEVKTRSTDAFGEPDVAIDAEKKNNLLSASRTYVRENHLEYLPVRFDTISVVGVPGALLRIDHKENAFDVNANYQFYDEKRKRARFRQRPGCW